VCVAAWFYPHDLLERAASTWQHTGRRLPRSAVLVAKGVAHYRNDSRGFRHADCVVAPTRALTAQLRRRGVAATWCVAPCAPVHVGDDAVAPQRDADAELPRLLVCCGDLSHPRKNVGMAVRAVAQVGRERPLVLELIGRNADALQREIAALPAGVRCVTTGALPADQVHVRMRAADALLFPSLYEEWGYVAAEAALHGTRVVALPVYPFEELLDGPWGRCAAGVTVEAYAHAVAGVLDSPADRQAIAAAAEQHLGLDAAARRLAEIWGAGPARVGTSAQVGP
jgi:glycosyltransferase involved in cell wall biosynthesis